MIRYVVAQSIYPIEGRLIDLKMKIGMDESWLWREETFLQYDSVCKRGEVTTSPCNSTAPMLVQTHF